MNFPPFKMSYEKWIKLLKHPMDINWSEPLTEEEKIKVCSNLPRIAEFMEKEQKELRQIKKMVDQFEREAGAKDTDLSKARLRMRLRMKLADKNEVKAKEKAARKHSCLNREDCERCQSKRAKKMLAAQKTLDIEKSKDPELSEKLQQNPDCEKKLLQYREPDKGNNDDEKEEDGHNNEAEEDNHDEDDGNELGAGAYALSQDYSSPYKDEAQEYKADDDNGKELGAAAYALSQDYSSPYKDEAQEYKADDDNGKELGAVAYALSQDYSSPYKDEAQEYKADDDNGKELGAAAYALSQDYSSTHKDEAQEYKADDDNGKELGAAAYALPRDYSFFYKDGGLYENHHEHQLKMQEVMDYFGNGLLEEGRRFNQYLPSHRFDYEDDGDEAVRGLKMKFLDIMSEEPKQSDYDSDFSKFLNYNYKF